uniref:Uncharacterized protein n=1 Tax=Magallana gigas TaxID=29159 RepID=K1QEU4_MAGGI
MSTPYVSFDGLGSLAGGSRFGQGWMGLGDLSTNSIMSGFGPPPSLIGGGFGQSMFGGFGEAFPMVSGGIGQLGGFQGISTIGGASGGVTVVGVMLL